MSAPELAGFAAAKGYALNSARSSPADLLSKDAPASVSKAGRGLRFGLDQIKVSAPVDQYEGLSRHRGSGGRIDDDTIGAVEAFRFRCKRDDHGCRQMAAKNLGYVPVGKRPHVFLRCIGQTPQLKAPEKVSSRDLWDQIRLVLLFRGR